MTTDEIVDALDALGVLDPEETHINADELLLQTVHADVSAAYYRVMERCRWWSHA